MEASSSVSAPSAAHSRRVEIVLLAVMVVAALTLLVLHGHPMFTKQELDFIVIPLVGAVFAAASAAYVLGYRAAAAFLVISVVVGWTMEELGVRTGAIFGEYVYGDALGPKLGSVPYVIPIFWFMIVYVSYAVSNLIAAGRLDAGGKLLATLWLSVLGAFVATAYDLGLDPYMSSPEIAAWTWADGGPYFGVPLQNFLGWIGTALLILLLFRGLHRGAPEMLAGATGRRTRFVAALPILVYASFWLSLLGPTHPAPTRIVCLIALGIPAMAAMAVWERWVVEEQSAAAASDSDAAAA